MTERLRAQPFAPYPAGDPRRSSPSEDEGLSTKKTMLVLVVVIGCFAVLWPKLFYPMLVNNANSQMKPGPVDKTTGCCDVISELDVDTIKIMSELCSTIIDTTGKSPPGPKEIVAQCRQAVLETCGIDISAALQDRIGGLGHSVKQILDEVRSLNGSLCLKYNFGLSPWRLGVPHRVHIHLDPLNTIRQERPTHVRSEMVHPAFKERGRAIPQPEVSGLPRRTSSPPRIVEGRPGPIPGMRPTMGGPGHVVAPSKQSNYGFMGVLMPIYTIGFVVFFSYTIMKLVFKKKAEAHVGAPLYPPCAPDERFHKEVFEANKNYFHRPSRDSSKIGDEELDQLRKRLRETELAMERIVEQMAQAPLVTQDEIKANGSLPKEDEQGTVKVMAMETTASCESGKKWSRPDSPGLPHPHPVVHKEPSPPPQQIFLEGSLPPQSQILVTESATETQKDSSEDDSPVVLAGKMTLSVISLDSESGTEESSNSGRKAETADEERRTSSSNVSDEFEKISAADLEDQINNIIEEAENIAMIEENRYSLSEELDKFTEEILKAPQINEKDKDNDVLEEIKNQLNLEDDLLLALKETEPEGKVSLPVTDIIKEFLNNEENALLAENKEIQIDDARKDDIGILERDKRSLSEEQDGKEFELNADLKGSEILNIINKEIDNDAGSEEVDFEVSEQQPYDLIAEESDKLVVELVHDSKPLEVNISNDDKRELLQETTEAAEGLDNEELQFSKDAKFEKIQQNLVPEHELISDLAQEKEAVSIEKEQLKLSNDDSQNLVTKNELVTDLSQKEKAVSKEKEELKLSNKDCEEIRQPLIPENEETSELPQKTISLEKEHLKLSTEDTVSKHNVVNDLPQTEKEETDSLENGELKLAKKEPDSEKVQQSVIADGEVIHEEKFCSIQTVFDLESSKEDLKNLVSENDKKYETKTENQSRERTPEESNGNKAELLLQGLIVKEDVELNEQNNTATIASSEKIEDHKELDNISTKTIPEKDGVSVDKQEQQATDTKEDNILSHAEGKRSVQSEESSRIDRPLTEDLQSLLEEARDEEISGKNVSAEDLNRAESSSRLIDEEGLIDDEDYDDSEDEELVDDEVRAINMEVYEDRRESMERRINGVDSSRNGAANSETAAENEISEEEDSENDDDDDEEIEEIIEYVDNTDDEGEEIVEINGNEQIHLNENGEH